MSNQATGGNRNSLKGIPIATVLFEPDPVLLDQLLTPLDRGGRPFYVFANGPLDPTIEKRLESLSGGVVIRSALNIGLGAALNTVMERAAADGFQYVLLLDQDSTPDSELPEQLLVRFQDQTTSLAPLAVLGPLLVTPQNKNYKPIRYAWRRKEDASVHFVPTSGSLISLAAWKDIGPFRADYFIDGIDVEWGFRAWSRGYRSIIATDIAMVHRWGTSVEEPKNKLPQILRQSDVRNFYYIRNTVDQLRLSYVPFGWKAWKVAVLAGQIARLLQQQRCNRKTRTVILNAVRFGMRGELGPIDSRQLFKKCLDLLPKIRTILS